MPQVNPEILVWARETSGLTREEAAKKLGFQNSGKSSAVEKLAVLEAGKKEPTRPQLVKMSEQYRRPLLAFYLSKPPTKGDRGADFRTLPSADYSALGDALLDALVRDVRARQSMVRALLEDEEEIEPLDFIGSHRLEDGSAAVLKSLQTLLAVDLATYRAQPNASGAFNLLRESVEKAGIFVLIKGDLGNYRSAIDLSAFRGFSIADEVAPFVVINDQDARSAWSFTLLHETTHLLLGQTGVGNTHAENAIERFCDEVAGKFLLTEQDLDALVLDDSAALEGVEERISEFADKRNISRTMAVYRVAQAGYISQEICRQLINVYREQWRENRERGRAQAREQESGPSFYTVRRHRLGNHITDLVRRMLDSEALSTSGAARILDVKSRQVQPLLNASSSL